MKKKTHEEFISQMNHKNPNITILDYYERDNKHILCNCKICGYEWSTTPRTLLNGSGCPKCAHKRINKSNTKTTDEFIEQMKKINSNIEIIGEYTNSNTPIKCKCKIDGYIWETKPKNLVNKHGCPRCQIDNLKRTHEDFVTQLHNVNKDIEVLGLYENSKTKIDVRCKNCYEVWSSTPDRLLRGSGCPVCTKNKRIVTTGVNDIATTHPQLVKYFKNPKDAKTHSYGESTKILLVCPDCGSEKMMRLNTLSRYGFYCSVCSDGISYPNKFLRALLSFLPLNNLQFEYSPSWAGLFKYDSYFEYNGHKYIVEMDGMLGHGKRSFGSNEKDKNGLKRDIIKDTLALENNIDMIRINCDISERDYIKNNIEKSKLSTLFDLSKIDWEYCDKFAQKSIIKEICKYYNDNFIKTASELEAVFNLSNATIVKYLRIGNNFGWCNYNQDTIDEVHRKNMEVLRKKNQKPVNVFDKDGNLIHQFDSMTIAARELSEKYNKKFHATDIAKVCVNERKTHGGFYYEFVS